MYLSQGYVLRLTRKLPRIGLSRGSDAASLPLIEPVYPLTAGLSGKVLRRAVGQTLARLPALPEWLDADVMRRQSFPDIASALTRLHEPADPFDVSPEGAAWRRLAYDEFLAGQVSLALVRARVRRLSGRPLTGGTSPANRCASSCRGTSVRAKHSRCRFRSRCRRTARNCTLGS